MKPQELDRLIQRLQATRESAGGDDDSTPEEIPDSEIVAVIQSTAQPVYQTAFNAGHSQATAKEREARDRLEEKLQAHQTKVKQYEERIQELEEGAPDAAQEREKYERLLEQEREKHRAELEKIQTETRQERKERALKDLAHALATKFGVDERYARSTARDPEVMKRITVGDDGNLEVRQADADIPLAPEKGQSPLDLLASELDADIPADFKRTNVDTGSGSKGGGGGGGSGGHLQDYRKKVEEEREKEAPARTGTEGQERLTGKRAASGR